MTQDSNEWREFFDTHAPDYMSNEFTKNTVAEVDFIVRELNLIAGSNIVDVGCGTGRHSVELAKRGFSVTGMDLSTGMLEQAIKAADKADVQVKWIQADATDFELDEKFDNAICLCEGAFGLLGSSDDPAEHDLAILRNINAFLKPGGKFMLTALNGFKLIRKYNDEDVAAGRLDPLFMLEKYQADLETPDGRKSFPVSERGFAPAELMLMLRMTGFEVEHIGGGTAGNWGRRPLELDEYEIMVIARKL